MAKGPNKKQRRPLTTPVPRPPQDKPAGPSTLAAEITAGIALVVEQLGAAPTIDLPPADDTSLDEVRDLWTSAVRTRMAYERAIADHDAREQELQRREQEMVERASADEATRAGLAELEHEQAVKEQERLARLAEIDARDENLLARETAFALEQERAKETVISQARAELSAVRGRFDLAQQDLDQELARQQSRLHEVLAAERQQVDQDRADLDEQSRRLRDLERGLRVREEDLADTKELYERRITIAVAAAVQEAQLRADHMQKLYEIASQNAEQHSRRIAEYERLMRAFGNQEPEEVLDELQKLRADGTELRRLRMAAPDETAHKLAALQEEVDRLRETCLVYSADNERLQRQLSAHSITATSLERLTVTREAMEAEIAAYRSVVEEQKADWRQLVERKEGASAFPSCSKMDELHADEREDLADTVPPLADLVTRVRDLIRQQHSLFYNEADLRSFLAGLASSQLHLLQGLSGIGKTQLPQRFAEAIGAHCTVVSIGADWRTPQDLMGYYNAFERRFYESEFTKALYRAQTPQFAAQPTFIVLDEMNLSHPEQYFNDVLSALEHTYGTPAIPDLVLMSSSVDPSPRLLREGRLLPLPKYVHFVGTANHDETTVSFADKTYDRAHVTELPAKPVEFGGRLVDPLPPLSFTALQAAFDAAAVSYADEANRTKAFLSTTIADRLAADFRIAWGSRLNRQLDRSLPVVMAAGGSIGEATDHILATKILRKLKGRYELNIDMVKRLRDDLPIMWSKHTAEDDPTQSLALLDDVIRHLGGA
ncbi:AAA family ATPase [Catellatospora sp. NPDC049111]|uniref:AAA family ATPase n=1 Tax=Catellatospora sp. NPDC049111 TaxID=3155271 RepID=UPI0033E64C9D